MCLHLVGEACRPALPLSRRVRRVYKKKKKKKKEKETVCVWEREKRCSTSSISILSIMMGRPSVSQKAFVNSIHHSLSVYLLICTYGAIVRQQGDVCKRQLFHVVLMYHLFYFFFFLAMALLIRDWCFLRQHGISPVVYIQYIEAAIPICNSLRTMLFVFFVFLL